jgi:CPA1 family monovalent cation:H+ antiporter
VADYRAMELYLCNDRMWSRTVRKMNNERRELELKAIQAERNEIQRQFEEGEIDRTLASHFRMDVNYREANLFETQAMDQGESV